MIESDFFLIPTSEAQYSMFISLVEPLCIIKRSHLRSICLLRPSSTSFMFRLLFFLSDEATEQVSPLIITVSIQMVVLNLDITVLL